MARIEQQRGFKTYTIVAKDGSTEATFIPEKGGMGAQIIMSGVQGPRKLLYQHDEFWHHDMQDLPGGWPFCFPVCARLERQGQVGAYLYDAKIYQLPIHGFAWSLPWRVTDQRDDMLEMSLQDSELTQVNYPFQFIVTLRYQVKRGLLTCEQSYTNTGDVVMPYNAGFHPYFLTPMPGQGKDAVTLDYKPTRRFKYNKKLTDLVGELDLFDLPTSIANPHINEQLTAVGEAKEVVLRYADGDVIRLCAQGVEDPNLFPYIQLYTMPDKPFFCVEPWMGFPNAMNAVQGMRFLQPGATEHGLLKLSLETSL